MHVCEYMYNCFIRVFIYNSLNTRGHCLLLAGRRNRACNIFIMS